ncbi:hypothetical protein PV325_007309, partial [Microctonus aethiopoides]
MDDLPVPLTSEEVILLKTFPPHELNWSNIIYKHFGDQPPVNILHFSKDVVNYQMNVLRILRSRVHEDVQEACPKCLYMHGSIGMMVGMLTQMSESVNDLMMNIFHLKREYEVEKQDLENASNSTIYSSDEIEDSTIVRDLMHNTIEMSSKVFQISEQTKQFILDRKEEFTK